MTALTNGEATGADPILERLLDEITDRLAAGEAVDAEEYARRHPEHAEALRRCLPAMEAMAGLRRSTSSPADSLALTRDAPHEAVEVLGDFRLLREVGRGGMGVVYEAEQVSLGRRVALKILPFAAVLDDRQLERFRREARAVAQLHHTNIVPVFSVGCERGVHYFAMQFINGQPLSRMIDGLRKVIAPSGAGPASPTDPGNELAYQLASRLLPGRGTTARDPQTTATYTPVPRDLRTPSTEPEGVQAGPGAGTGPATHDGSGFAISSAHPSSGPSYFEAVARLGIQAAEALEHAHGRGVVHRDIKPANLLIDDHGDLWVTDFGLAQLQDDRGLTMTGDVIGTLRYMSPEQAAARKDLDHRTDIYSLGVTLYELMALRPAVGGAGRRDILRAVVAEEPPPLRRLNRAVPRDLETIVAKAMAKEPEKRYATARGLADDLRAFQEHRPIAARPPGPLERATKWVRRHRVVATSAVCVAVASFLALAFAVVAHQRQIDKLKAELVAQRATQEKLVARVDALVEQAQRLSSGFAPDHARAVSLLTEAIVQRPGDADLYLYRGSARCELHEHEAAVADLERSLKLRPARNPAAHWMIAVCALQLGQIEKARQHQEQASKEDPDSVEALVTQALGLAYDERGVELMDRAIEREPFNPTLYFHRGRIASNLVIHRTERKFYQRAVDDLGKALKARPGDPAILDPLCYCLLNHSFHDEIGDWPAVRARGKLLLDEWHERHPRDPLALLLLADYHLWRNEFGPAVEAARAGQGLAPDNHELALRLARALDGLGRHDQALQAFDRSLELKPTLGGHAWRARCLGLHLGQRDRAIRELNEAYRKLPVGPRSAWDWIALIDIYHDLGAEAATRATDEWVRAAPDASFAYSYRAGHRLWFLKDYRGAVDDCTRALELGALPMNYCWRAEAQLRLGRFDEALGDNERFILSPTFRPIDGVRTQEQGMFLTSGYRLRAEILEKAGRYDEAERARREGLDMAAEVLTDGPLRDQYLIWPVGEYYASLSKFLRKVGQTDDAARLIEALGEESFENANCWVWEMMARTYYELGALLSRTDQPRAEERAWRRVVLLSERMARAEPHVPRHDRDLARCHLQLAELLRRTGRTSEAEERERRSAQAAGRWREAVDRMVEQKPEDADELNGISWWLATWPVPAMRDPARAVELARKAVEREPKNGAYWGTLGVADYRAGDWGRAVEDLERSRELLGKTPDARLSFALAMARWRQGSQDEARTQFERASTTMGRYGMRDDEVRRFRDEAAALLDVKMPRSEEKPKTIPD